MHRTRKFIAFSASALAIIVVLAIGFFELTVVQPALTKAHSLINMAAPGERNLPGIFDNIIKKDLGDRIKYLVARDLLITPPSQVEGMRTINRGFTEFFLGLLLKLHLSTHELQSIFVSQAYMGPEVRGFDHAATRYLGTQLEHVSIETAAWLVALSNTPSAYLRNPEDLAHRVKYLLAEPGQSAR